MENEELKSIVEHFDGVLTKRIDRLWRNVRDAVNAGYSQMESLFWLEKKLELTEPLPPLRGWATSPDLLLKIHTYITQSKPNTIVEFGSGASTLVIADALRKNGGGKLYSFDDSEKFGAQTQSNIERELLVDYVDLTVAPLEPWRHSHLSSNQEVPLWYSAPNLDGLENIDLVLVDGPPGNVCKYSRFPAVPAVIDKLHSASQVWMDDTVRDEETQICKAWAELTKMSLEFISLEKGLGVLSYSDENNALSNNPITAISEHNDSIVSKLDFR